MMSRQHYHPAPMGAARAALWSITLAATAAAGLMVSPATRAADVGVSISLSQPGVYGRVDIGRFPQPELVVAQPVVIQRPRVVMAQPVQPVYLWVPPGHQKNWSKHCYRYNACGVPVYFVKEDWYRAHVAPPHAGRPAVVYEAQSHGHGHGHGRGHDHD
jgi:hypothetical protein